MADDSEIIGAIGVSITGDYSSLQAAFTSAQGAAQQAGEDIADALAAGGAAGADLGEQIAQGLAPIAGASESANQSLTGLADAIDAANAPATDLSASLGDLGDSAGGAKDAVDGLGNALPDAADGAKEVDESSKEASNSLAEMAEKMAAVGEALVITEGLRELGSEALGATDSITTASIALTTMTGSADTAHETIEQLEQLGMQDGLAMPSLLTAAQRMTAMLPPGTDVANLLGSIADGAAVMGSGIDQAANRFDQMTNSGTLAARSLMSLGLSLTTVATAMNTVDPSADATATTVAAMFKAMDPGDRITVLQTALASLGGTAQQVANQTFGGQWQQLADAWEGIMVQVGQAILPVISDLISLTKTDIVPFVQGAVSAFNSLPGPVKDTAVAVGLALAAVIPLSGALAAGSLAVGAISELMPALTGLMETLGVTCAGTATEIEAVTVAEEGVGAVAAEGAVETAALGTAAAGLGTVLGVTLAAGITAVAALTTDWQQRNAAVLSSLQGISASDFSSWLTQTTTGLKTATLSTEDAEAATAKFKSALDLGVISAQQYKTAIEGIETAAKNFADQDLQAFLSGWTSGLTIVTETTKKATDQQTLLNEVLTAAETAFQKIAAQYQSGTATAQQYLAAQNAVTTAQKAVNDAVTAGVAPVQTIDEQVADLTGGLGALASSQQIATAQADAQSNKLVTLSASLLAAQEKLVLTDDAQRQIARDVEAGIAPQSDLTDAMNATEKAATAVTTAQKAYDDAMVAVGNNAVTAGNQIQTGMLTALQNLAGQLPPTVTDMLGLHDAIANLQSQMPSFGIVTTALSGGPLTGLQSALAEATAKVQDLGAKMQDGANVGQQYEKALTAQLNAQIALDQESATLGTGLQGATDAISLATIAVADAKAKYNDLVTAWQAGQPVLTQLEAAQKALKTAQDNLNTAVGQASPLIHTQTSEQQSLTPAVTGATTAISNQTTALNADAAALQSVASAVQQVESDFSSAMGSVPSAATAGAPAGYEWQVTTIAGHQTATLVPLPETSYKLAEQAAEAVTATSGTTPQDLAADVLAEAQAVLKVDQEYYGEKSSAGAQIVTAQALQSAQQAVATAQAALTAFTSSTSSSTSSSSSTGTTNSGTTPQDLAEAQAADVLAEAQAVLKVDQEYYGENSSAGAQIVTAAQQAVANAQAALTALTSSTSSSTSSSSSTGTTNNSQSSTTSSASTESAGSSAIDGGSYTPVTAHQASGEVWAVSTSGASVSGSVATTSVSQTVTNTTVSDASTGALVATASAVGSAVQEIATFSGGLLPITTNLANVASSITTLVSAVGGVLQRLSTGSTVTSAAPASVYGNNTGERSYTTGTESTYYPGGNPMGSTVSTPNTGAPAVPGGNAGSGPTSINAPVNVTVNTSNPVDANQLATQIANTLVSTLRTAGARF